MLLDGGCRTKERGVPAAHANIATSAARNPPAGRRRGSGHFSSMEVAGLVTSAMALLVAAGRRQQRQRQRPLVVLASEAPELALADAKGVIKEELDEEIDRFIRLQADLQNYRREHEQSISRARDLGKQDALRNLLPLSKTLDEALVPPENMLERERSLFDSYSRVFGKMSEILSRSQGAVHEVEGSQQEYQDAGEDE